MLKIDRNALIELLTEAEKLGIIAALDDRSMRDIRFITSEGADVRLEWYVNLITVHFPGFQMWAESVTIQSTHPSFGKHLTFSYHGVPVGFIGIPYFKSGEAQ